MSSSYHDLDKPGVPGQPSQELEMQPKNKADLSESSDEEPHELGTAEEVVRQEKRTHDRAEHWSSRTTFILAAIGSAIGFGNVWRFPYLVHEHGGGTFLVPYLIALFCFGIPVLTLEISLGQLFQRTTLEVFSGFGWRWRGIGWASALGIFVITFNYMILLSWTSTYVVCSFSNPLPWQHDPTHFFHSTVLHESSSIAELGSLVPHLVGALFVMWFVVLLGLLSGADSIGKFVKIVMPLPFVVMGILLCVALSKEGAFNGIQRLFKPNLEKLWSIDVWGTAFGQIFFSLSVGINTMVTYGSYNNRTDPHIITNCFIVAISNSAFSIVSAITLFAFLGHLAHTQNIPFDDVVQSGPGLMFEVFPRVFELLPWSNVFAVLFFVMLLCLGLTSAVSMVEPMIETVIHALHARKIESGHKHHHHRHIRPLVTAVLCFFGFLGGLLMCTKAGPYWVELFDKALPLFLPLSCALLECVCVTTTHGTAHLLDEIEEICGKTRLRGWFYHSWSWIVPSVLTVLVIFEAIELGNKGFKDFAVWAVIFAVSLALIVVGIIPAMAVWRPSSHKK